MFSYHKNANVPKSLPVCFQELPLPELTEFPCNPKYTLKHRDSFGKEKKKKKNLFYIW